MDSLESTLFYSKYKDVEDLETTYEMWETLKIIYGGDRHVMKDKDIILRVKFDDMRMQEDNILRPMTSG